MAVVILTSTWLLLIPVVTQSLNAGKWYWETYLIEGSQKFFGVVDVNHLGTDLSTATAGDSAMYGQPGVANIYRGITSYTIVQAGVTSISNTNIIGIACNNDVSPPTIQLWPRLILRWQ